MLSRQVIDALMPGGSLWVPQTDGGLDLLLDGVAGSDEVTREFLSGLARLRDPVRTPVLEDLEEEYGLLAGPLSETDRRARLLAVATAGSGNGTAEYLQAQLRKAGFDAYVHPNSPRIDPALFLYAGGGAIFGREDSVFGNENAYFAASDIVRAVVNGDPGDTNFTVPVDPNYWPMVFFVGGAATYGTGGELTGITPARVDIARKDEFYAAIVKYKPMGTWAGLTVQFVAGV